MDLTTVLKQFIARHILLLLLKVKFKYELFSQKNLLNLRSEF